MLQNKLTEQFKLDVIGKKYETVTPTTVVLLQELERFNKLNKRIGVSLASLQKVRLIVMAYNSLQGAELTDREVGIPSTAIVTAVCSLAQALAGEVGMSNELDELAKALFNGQLPSIWRALAPATLKSLGNWMSHFLRRNDQYKTWVSEYVYMCLVARAPSYSCLFQVNDGEPFVMWLSGLHIAQSYLTALVQATCRKNGWPLDRSTLYTSVTEVSVIKIVGDWCGWDGPVAVYTL